jgi:hypothetical protein
MGILEGLRNARSTEVSAALSTGVCFLGSGQPATARVYEYSLQPLDHGLGASV